MQSVSVTIGRNIGEEPMSDAEWVAFRVQVRQLIAEALLSIGGEITFAGQSAGWWNGHPEDNYHVAAIVPNIDENRLNIVRASLRRIGRQFEQDAIAFTHGTAELITQ